MPDLSTTAFNVLSLKQIRIKAKVGNHNDN